ncbi:MAG: hypothetical protein ABSF53_17295 [Terracidiphilus sp.]
MPATKELLQYVPQSGMMVKPHQTTAPVELGVDKESSSSMQPTEFREGGRLMLLSVFETLNGPRIDSK